MELKFKVGDRVVIVFGIWYGNHATVTHLNPPQQSGVRYDYLVKLDEPQMDALGFDEAKLTEEPRPAGRLHPAGRSHHDRVPALQGTTMPATLDINDALKDAKLAARRIKVPLAKWPRNCCYIATLFLRHKLVTGKLCYGMYAGPIHPSSIFGGHPFARHGWVEIEPGTVCDPTRWVFELVPPYIYIGPDQGQYDLAASRTRQDMNLRGPCPGRTPVLELFSFTHLRDAARTQIKQMVPTHHRGTITRQQAFWLANAPLLDLGNEAYAIYRWLIAEDLGAYIPIDNRRYVLGCQ